MSLRQRCTSVSMLCCLAFSFHLAGGQSTVPQHPLDALTTQEYWAVHDVLQASGHLGEKTLISSLLLHEPPKEKVLAWKDGDPITRESDIILEDTGKTYEALVDITNHKLESWKEMPGVQAPYTESEFTAAGEIIKKDPRVIEALKKRGITDLSTVRCNAGPLSFISFPEQEHDRVGFGGCSDMHGVYHAWGRTIEGLWIVMNTTTKKILQVIDTGVVPMATSSNDFEEVDAVPRAGTTPIELAQPLGPAYQISKGEISWQNWHFRFRLDSRIGPVLAMVRYDDNHRLRSVMYEGSLSEMYVPYMHPAMGWNTRAFLDAGEYLLGGLLKPLASGIDCPSNAQIFTGLVPSDHGFPTFKTGMACLFERTTGDPAWRHFENGVVFGRPSRELVLRSAAVIGNYDYVFDWIFQQDGTIRVAVGATGIIETMGVQATTAEHHSMGDGKATPEYGTLVAPNTLGVNHDHYFSYRLDLDVDGTNNSFMIDRLVAQKLPTNIARKSIWAVESSIAHTEQDGILDADLRKPAMWAFVNTSEHTSQGYPTGYEIMPGATAVSLMSPDDPSQKVGAFSAHQLWVTPYKANELYASGTYVTSSKGDDGLAVWTKANRPIENTDVVAWYTLGFHHAPRVEDWPVMPTMWHDFLIRPINFFSTNPVLTLPNKP